MLRRLWRWLKTDANPTCKACGKKPSEHRRSWLKESLTEAKRLREALQKAR